MRVKRQVRKIVISILGIFAWNLIFEGDTHDDFISYHLSFEM